MIPIRPIGCFFSQDENGNILNPCHKKHIPPFYWPFFEAIIEQSKKNLGPHFHSVYLRGSLPRGFYKKGLSDVDIFILAKDEKYFKSRPVNYHQAVLQQYPEFNNVDIVEYGYSNDLEKAYPQLAMIIKTQSLLLAGVSIQAILPKYRAGKKMMLHYRWLEEDWNNFLNLPHYSSHELKAICKILLRTGFELVMEREMKYTNDLYICYTSFSKYYPKQAKMMREVLKCYLNPVPDNKLVKKTIEELGKRMLIEVESLLF